MSSFKARWATLWEALGHRRYFVANGAANAAGGAVAIFGALGMSAYFTQWALFVAILVAILFWIVLGYATDLRLAGC